MAPLTRKVLDSAIELLVVLAVIAAILLYG